MTQYIAMTVGPIVDTVSLAESPAGLFFASAMFSDLCHRLCCALQDKWPALTFITPSHPTKNGFLGYHDRIICRGDFSETQEALYRAVGAVVEAVKHEVAQALCQAYGEQKMQDFFFAYLQVFHLVCSQQMLEDQGEKNCILALSPYLDSAELCACFPTSFSAHPLQNLFDKKHENAGNSKLINSYLMQNEKIVARYSLLKRDGGIRDLKSIAGGDGASQYKTKNYFAVVQSDGDHIGALLQGLSDENEIQSFSKACLNYNEKAAEMVKTYGGMTIYAGGDDLLFLAPLVGQGQKSLFTLCGELSECLRCCLGEAGLSGSALSQVSVSFGIAIHYYKFPLYEALADARNQLFGVAKCEGNKNQMAISLRKHSGQSLRLLLPHTQTEAVEAFHRLLSQAIASQTDATDQAVHSVQYALGRFAPLFQMAKTKEEVQNLFANLFDNIHQQAAEGYIRQIAALYVSLLSQGTQNRIMGYDTKAEKYQEKDISAVLQALLRLIKLHTEQEGD